MHIELSLKTLNLAIQSNLCPVQLWCSPSTDHDFFRQAHSDYGVTLHQQQGADLGIRMHQAFCAALADYNHALLIGCDCVSLTQNDLTEALQSLHGQSDLVIAPAEDGGYVLIGLSQAEAELFADISWGTTEVLCQTRTRSRNLNLHHFELPLQWDVDTFSDLTRYRDLSKNT